MGCSQSSAVVTAEIGAMDPALPCSPSSILGQGADKYCAVRSALIVQGSVELECSDPALSKGFDSFRHIAGLADRQAVEEGRSLRQKNAPTGIQSSTHETACLAWSRPVAV